MSKGARYADDALPVIGNPVVIHVTGDYSLMGLTGPTPAIVTGKTYDTLSRSFYITCEISVCESNGDIFTYDDLFFPEELEPLEFMK